MFVNNDLASGAWIRWERRRVDRRNLGYRRYQQRGLYSGKQRDFRRHGGECIRSAQESVTSLEFQTTGYVLNSGNSLNLLAPTISTNSGVTATINSVITGNAGLIKNGPGILNLTAVETYKATPR